MNDKLIHFNTAGAGLMPSVVSEAMIECVRAESVKGAYETERHYERILHGTVYERIARLVDAPREDIALFDSATRAWCSVVSRLELAPTDRIWVTPYEYAGNLISLFALRDRCGCRIEVIPARANGDLDLEWMTRNITDGVSLVSVPHIPSGCGIVNPVVEIGRILAPYRSVYAVDACQSVGQTSVRVAEIGCDLLTGAGRKFLRGPRGSGFAAVSSRLRAMLVQDFHDLHVARVVSGNEYKVEDHSARALELAERTTAMVVGFDAALEHAEKMHDPAAQRAVAEALRAALGEIEELELITPGDVQSGIVSFRHARYPANRVCEQLAEQSINVWHISGDHTPLYLAERGIDTAVRASVHYYNTVEEVAVFGRVVRELIGS